MKKEKMQKKLNNLKTKIQRRVIKYAPAAIGALTTWVPVNLARAETSKNFNKDNIEMTHSQPEEQSRLIIASPNAANAYNKSISQISVATEAEHFENPTAVVSPKGYYGQHQFGNSSKNGFMVRKYIAYALAYGSEDFKDSAKQNLLIGKDEAKNHLIEAFSNSLDAYENAPENAYMPSNPAYKKLFNAMNVNPSTFSEVHNQHPKEAVDLQKNFVYEVYLNLMPYSLKSTIAKHPRISFEQIHPAVWGSVIAISIKQGNGARFEASISKMEKAAEKLRSDKEKIETGKITNTDKWLKDYCSGFTKVYNAAKGELGKVPTLDAYYEISVIINKPEFYNIIQNMFHKEHDFQEAVTAIQQKSAEDDMALFAVADATKVEKLGKEDKMASFRQRMKQYREKQNNETLTLLAYDFGRNNSNRS